MKVFGVAGWSGSGKTTLVTKLIPALVGRGLTVSTMKHAHHGFDVDHPGKDSYEHRAAGATEVMVTSGQRWALMHELRGGTEPDVGDLTARMTPVDLLLVEGYKRQDHEKLEVYRAVLNKPLLCRNDPRIIAVASDEALPEIEIQRLDLNDIEGIAGFIIDHCGLEAAALGVA